MPTITRWFNVTHDINADPEIWELREKFTDRAGFIWLECLAIADRNSGVVGPASDQTRNQLASKCRTSRVKVESVLDWCRVKGWLRFGEDIEVAKWSKYNKTRDTKKLPSYPNLPNPPNHKDTISSASDEDNEISVKDLVESWNEIFKGRLPQVEWPLSKTRHHKCACRLKEHSRLDFWQRVFDNIGESQFLLGRSNGSWACTLDFLIANDTNCTKIYEGSYK